MLLLRRSSCARPSPRLNSKLPCLASRLGRRRSPIREAEREQIVLERGVEAWERYRAARIQLMDADFAQSGRNSSCRALRTWSLPPKRLPKTWPMRLASVGGAIGAITVEITRFASAQVAAAQRVAEAEREHGRTSFQYADARAAQASAEINHYGNLASAAKGFFKEGSDGYKALLAAEKVFRAFELAIAIKNAAVKDGLIGAQTAAKVTSDTAMAASRTPRVPGSNRATRLSRPALRRSKPS